MEKVNLDWLASSIFLMIASAEITDHYLTEEEIITIIVKGEGLASKFDFEGVSFNSKQVAEKFNSAFEWYNTVGDNAPKGKLNAHILQEVYTIANSLKEKSWFSDEFAQTLLNDLISIAKADDELINNEKKFINSIASQWNLSTPFDV